MTKFISIVSLFFLSVIFTSVYVPGYTQKNGKYVPPHYETNPDNNSVRADNWSNNKGTYNPFTGKQDMDNKDSYDNANNNTNSSYADQ